MHERIHTTIEREVGPQPVQDDVLCVELTGRHPHGVMPNVPQDLEERFWHVHVVNQAEPDYDLEAYRHSKSHTVEARFARELLHQMDEESDPEKRAILKEALYMGLDALTLGKVFVRETGFLAAEDEEDDNENSAD